MHHPPSDIAAPGPAQRVRALLLPGETPITTLAVLFCCGWYVAVGLQSSTFTPLDGFTLMRAGANAGPLAAHGEPWRVATYAWLHGDLIHLAMNMVALVQTGRLIERVIGSARFALLYSLCAVGGGIASAALTEGSSVGASGAIFGVAAATVVWLGRVGTEPAMRARRQLMFWLGLFLVIGFGGELVGRDLGIRLDNWAHLGGLVVGVLLALRFFPASLRGRARPASRALMPAGLAVVALFVAAPAFQQWEWHDVPPHRGVTDAQRQAARLAAWAPCRAALTGDAKDAIAPCLAFRRTAFEVVPAYELLAEVYGAAGMPERAQRDLALLDALGGDPLAPYSGGDAMVIAMRAAAMDRVLSSVTPERVTAPE